MTNQENHPSIELPAPAYRLPDLESWMSEIEEFVSEISGDLNSIAESLGDRLAPRSGPPRPSQTPTHTDPPDPVAAAQVVDQQADEPRATSDSAATADRLGTLKRRLASLKSESRPTDDLPPRGPDHE